MYYYVLRVLVFFDQNTEELYLADSRLIASTLLLFITFGGVMSHKW